MATPHAGVCHGLDNNEIYIVAMITLTNDYTKTIPTFDGTAQDRGISIADALEIPQSCTRPSQSYQFKDYVDLAADKLVSGNVPDNNSFFYQFYENCLRYMRVNAIF